MQKIGRVTPFSYNPDPDAVIKRMVREAEAIYQMGLETCRHQPVLTDYDGVLDKFYLHLTFNCPLHCPYCYADAGNRKMESLDAGAFIKMTEDAISAGYKAIVVTGGEPLVYPGFSTYLDGLEQMERLKTRLILRSSFGFSIDEALLKRVCRIFDEIVVSLDGDEATHDAERGCGTFKITTSNIERAIAFGGNIAVNAVMDGEQQKGTPGLFIKDYCLVHGISKYKMNTPVPMGRASQNLIPFFELRSDAGKQDCIYPRFKCGLGYSLYIRPDGKAFPCYSWCEDEHCVGDLSKESLKDIMDRGALLDVINSGVDTNRKCRTCDVRYFCGGMCKLWVDDKHDIDSEDFDCGDKRRRILNRLKNYGIQVME